MPLGGDAGALGWDGRAARAGRLADLGAAFFAAGRFRAGARFLLADRFEAFFRAGMASSSIREPKHVL
jgi:hypothetical protein